MADEMRVCGFTMVESVVVPPCEAWFVQPEIRHCVFDDRGEFMYVVTRPAKLLGRIVNIAGSAPTPETPE